MLTKLTIQNYALIDHLSIEFNNGLSIITGETGAGKSILLGALGLILGNRADSTTLKDTTKKCVVEAEFDIAQYNLQRFFEKEDLDFEQNSILRREILPSGKSRAFVNDTPVNLSILNQLKQSLIDVHSQHQTLQLSDSDFQFSVLDALAKTENKLASYKRGLQQYNSLQKELEEMKLKQREAHQQYDYNLHLFTELDEANLQSGEQEELEENLAALNNVEEIKSNLSEAINQTTNNDLGLQSLLYAVTQNLSKISSYSKKYEALAERISSVKIEVDDIANELETAFEAIDFNPNQLELYNDRLQLIYNLQKKHYVSSIDELLTIYTELQEKVNQVTEGDDVIANKENEIKETALKLDSLAATISLARKKVIPNLQGDLKKLLENLGMQNAVFDIKVNPSSNYYANGKDELSFLFSANKGASFGELKKVASGGELSRVMLSIKRILAENTSLPTIIFDEIDTGVSGEVSNKIAAIMQQMAKHMQVIAITHLPQIAAKGKQHYKVYKEDVSGVTTSNLKLLSDDQRIVEIAEMLSGKDISDSALTHAKELLN